MVGSSQQLPLGGILLLLILVMNPALVRGTNYTKDVKFYLFGSNYTDRTEVSVDVQSFLDAGWKSLKPVKIIVHGYNTDITDPVFKNVAGAYLETGFDGNVVGVDWSAIAEDILYIRARLRVKAVGNRLAYVVNYLINNTLATIEDIHLIGHSLGAHVVGSCGQKLQKTYNYNAKRITGLDPALPLFILLSYGRLNKNDAELVDVIHTCGGYMGMIRQLGDYDFYPNGGRPIQPGCTLAEELDFSEGSCSHLRSHELMGSSIRNSSAFKSTLCASQSAAHKGKCSSNITAHMAHPETYKTGGPYYLKTTGKSPYWL